jgi:hypothetical protein
MMTDTRTQEEEDVPPTAEPTITSTAQPEEGIEIAAAADEELIQMEDGSGSASATDTDTVQAAIGKGAGRAEFISASFHRTSIHDDPFGLNLHSLPHEGTAIDSISPHCLASNSPLQAGDFLVQVNDAPCWDTSAEDLYNQLHAMTGIVTIVVQNKAAGAVPNLVESMITKGEEVAVEEKDFMRRSEEEDTKKSSKPPSLGLGLRSKGNNLIISSLDKTKPMAGHSLLKEGDILISINGESCYTMTPAHAVELLQAVPPHEPITMVAKTPLGDHRRVYVPTPEVRKRMTTGRHKGHTRSGRMDSVFFWYLMIVLGILLFGIVLIPILIVSYE